MRAVAMFRAFFVLLLLCGAASAQTSNVTFVGQIGYAVNNNTVDLRANEVRNLGETSNNLRLELWAFPQPFDGTPQTGFRMAVRDLGVLAGGASFTNIQGAVPFTPPPTGTWYFSMFLTEFTGSANNQGYSLRAYGTFPTPVTFGVTEQPFVPSTGLWWNPQESGTGYTVQVRHGVLILIMYSFQADGDPIWYIYSGPLTVDGGALTLSGTLDKYRGGQCAGCTYNGRPDADGNDGPFTIRFTSPTSGFIAFGSGRVVQIEPYNF